MGMLKSSKFVISLLGLLVTTLTAITKTMDANVMACVIAICGGFAAANTIITKKALEPDSKSTPPPAGDVA